MKFDEYSQSTSEILFANLGKRYIGIALVTSLTDPALDIVPSAISWAIVELAMHPDIQTRLFEEIKATSNDTSLGTTDSERRGSYIRKTNTLLHYSYLESSRLRPLTCKQTLEFIQSGSLISSSLSLLVLRKNS